MLHLKFESIYTEVDRQGNSRRWENRFEATGSGQEVCMALDHLLGRVSLPGTQPFEIPQGVRRQLLTNSF